ncbi:hypothetical protein F8388_003499 [Cannabis sativa]|uniref:Ubiquitin-like protease family profile domain-containing protein n=1 Tax=Cannabis sativa TaxID=3483 RepID=A0A7J6F2K8_CANSA|nr:hypothetical protein F8388_003499 [Cannabis sativa]KAF4378366.1 hypothetical protein G4B88_025859 [Cannabis sativa]
MSVPIFCVKSLIRFIETILTKECNERKKSNVNIGSSNMAGKRKRKGAAEPVKKDVSPESNDNVVAWRNFFNANYKALRAAEKELTEKEEYFSKELKSQLRSFSLKVMDKGEGVRGEVGKKAECSQAVEESPSKTPVRSKNNVVGKSEENVVESVSTPLLSATKSVEDECYPDKTIEDDDFDIVEVAYVLVKFRKFEVDRRCMASLRPLRGVEGSIIDCFSVLMNKYEHDSRLLDQPRQKTLGSFNVKRIVKERERYEDNFRNCVKMFVPVLTLEGPPHWFGAELNMKSKVVSFLDSLHTAVDEKYRVDATKEMLSTLDLLFDENKSKNVTFVDFRIDSKDRGLPQQDNDRDCSVYVMKYMEVVANEEEVVDQFHPIEARLEIAARIITDEQNELRTKVVEDRRVVQGSSFASSSAPLRSPSKSPGDPQFSTGKSRHTNMYPPSKASPRFRSTKAKISYGCLVKSYQEMLTKTSNGWSRLDGTTSNTAKSAIQLKLPLSLSTMPSWDERC